MKLGTPKNTNYCATVVEIRSLIPLEGCDNLMGTMLFGCHVIVGKDNPVGTIGIYFPVETQLSKEFLSANNLYRKAELNTDPEKKGYFEENGRIRCVKLRGHQSNGFFIPLESLKFIDSNPQISTGAEFDSIDNVPICQKYIPKSTRTPGAPGSSNKGRGRKARESKLIENQFRFHYDTTQLGKNLHKIHADSLISITYKVHGTSGISGKVLCKRKLSLVEKALKWTKLAKISESEYDYINSSRKVIKNDDLNPNPSGYYSEDIWSIAGEELKPYLLDGMTLYYEIVGYLPGGGQIQGSWDYGCKPGEHKIYVYRITYTNDAGQVFEFSAKQVQDWCKSVGLTPVVELYYGRAEDFSDIFVIRTEASVVDDSYHNELNCRIKKPFDAEEFQERIKKLYNEKDCYLCANKVPEEGVVVKVEGPLAEAFKQKSFRFLDKETRDLDANKSDIETEN